MSHSSFQCCIRNMNSGGKLAKTINFLVPIMVLLYVQADSAQWALNQQGPINQWVTELKYSTIRLKFVTRELKFSVNTIGANAELSAW